MDVTLLLAAALALDALRSVAEGALTDVVLPLAAEALPAADALLTPEAVPASPAAELLPAETAVELRPSEAGAGSGEAAVDRWSFAAAASG